MPCDHVCSLRRTFGLCRLSCWFLRQYHWVNCLHCVCYWNLRCGRIVRLRALCVQFPSIEWGVLRPILRAVRHMQHYGDIIRRPHIMQLLGAIGIWHAESLDHEPALLCRGQRCAHRISGLDCEYQRLLQYRGHGRRWWNGHGRARIRSRREQSVFPHGRNACYYTRRRGWGWLHRI